MTSKQETGDAASGQQQIQTSTAEKKNKLNLQCLQAQSSVDLLTSDNKSLNTVEERKRSNSFAARSFEEPASETL